MWILFSLLAALSAAGSRAIIKKAGESAGNRSIVFCRSAFGAALAWTLILFTGVPLVESGFFISVTAGCAFDVAAILCMSRALREGSLAQSVPLLSFTPVFLLLTGHLILGESPTLLGIIGVIVIVGGSYFLHVKPQKQSILEPFKLLFSSSSARLMLLCAFLFGFTGPFFKAAVQRSDPFFTMAISLSISSLMVVCIQWATGTTAKKLFPTAENWKPLVLVGVAVFCVALSVNVALTSGLVSYVISLKRLGVLINIIIGVLLFGEKNLFQNLFAGGLMVTGATLITLS